MSIDANYSGGFFGFSFDETTWKLKKFDSEEKAFSLCTFSGNSQPQIILSISY